MEWNWKEYNKQKHQFRSHYCSSCKQTETCGILGLGEDCCSCYFQSKQTEAQEYSNYQLVYQQKVKEKKEKFQQLELLRNYLSCPQCRSKEVDAYELYENSRLVCQPCLMRKEGGASGAISFLGQRKWYKKSWGIDLIEWLEKFQCLNVECAGEWLKDREHLKNCDCLEVEARKLVDLFSNSLKECQEKLKECKCEVSNKPRTPYYDSANYGYTYCEKCKTQIKGAGKMGIIKNRNDPRFWGLKVEEKVLCLKCLGKFREKMSVSKQYTFNKYVKRYLLKEVVG
jgi:hypothetical protein